MLQGANLAPNALESTSNKSSCLIPASVHIKRDRSETYPGSSRRIQSRNRRRGDHGLERGQRGELYYWAIIYLKV